jgi:hypothetical protein
MDMSFDLEDDRVRMIANEEVIRWRGESLQYFSIFSKSRLTSDLASGASRAFLMDLLVEVSSFSSDSAIAVES